MQYLESSKRRMIIYCQSSTAFFIYWERTVNSVAARMVWCMAVRNYSTKKLDLSGQTFGRLTVLAPAENIGGKTAWLCQCECGNTAVVLTQRLRDGHRTSCGCDSELFGETPAVIGRASLTYIDGTCVEMIRAKTVRKNNTSGVPGVDWVAGKRLWRATICFKGKRHYLGSYHNFEDAVEARKKGEKKFYETFLQEFEETSEQSSQAAG